jgi:hypothetical protein
MEIINDGYFQTLYEESLDKLVENVNLIKELRSDNKKLSNKSITLTPRFRDIMLPFYLDKLEQKTLLTLAKNYVDELNNNIVYSIKCYSTKFEK